MYICPVNYQTHVNTNKYASFQSKSTLPKPIEEKGKKTFSMMAGSILAYLGLTKKSKKDALVNEESNTTLSITDGVNKKLRDKINDKLGVDCNNEYSIYIGNKIISDKNLYDLATEGNLRWFVQFGLSEINSKEQAEIVDKILFDERLYKNCSNLTINNIVKSLNNTSVNGVEYTLQELAQAKIKLLDKILSDEKLFNNDKFVENILNNDITDLTPEFLQPQIAMIDKILSDKRLYNNNYFMQFIDPVKKASSENLQFKFAMTDKILSDKRLYDKNIFMNCAPNVIGSVNSQEDLDCGIIMIDKILSDEKLYKNDDFMYMSYLLINNIRSQADLERKFELIDMILSDKNLYDNNEFMQYSVSIIDSVETAEQMKIAKKIFSDKELCKNEIFLKECPSIMQGVKNNSKGVLTPEALEFVNIFLSDKRFSTNKHFIENADEIIRNINEHPEHAKIVMDLIERLSEEGTAFDNPKVVKNLTKLIVSVINT